jgi:hypothetical protein
MYRKCDFLYISPGICTKNPNFFTRYKFPTFTIIPLEQLNAARFDTPEILKKLAGSSQLGRVEGGGGENSGSESKR